jgi:ribosome-associated protein
VNRLTADQLGSELTFAATRSSGAGGQNVNKVNSKVVLRWNIANSKVLSSEQKDLLLQKLKRAATIDGVLIVTSQEYRSQLQNRDAAIQKLNRLLDLAFKKVKVRKASKPSKATLKKRIENKRKQSEKKQSRKRFEE